MSRKEPGTPYVLIDLDKVEANIQRLQRYLDNLPLFLQHFHDFAHRLAARFQ